MIVSDDPTLVPNPRLVPYKFVLVVFVPVAFTQIMSFRFNDATARLPKLAFVA